MIGWVQPFIFVLAAAGALRVETGTPDALCPELGEVRRAVQARLGDIEADGKWLASYALVHRPDAESGDVVRLELRDPTGRLRLRRDLPRAGASCKAVTQVLVVVLDSYFRRPNDGADPGAVPVVAAAPQPRSPPQPALNPGIDIIGGWAGGPSSPAVAVEAWLSGRSGWAARLQGAWMLSKPATSIDLGAGTPGASAAMRSGAIRAALAGRWRPGATIEMLAGPEALLVVERVETIRVPAGTTNMRAGWGVGASGQMRLRVAPRVALALDVAADYTPPSWGGAFEITDYGELFPPPRVRIFVGAGLSLALFE